MRQLTRRFKRFYAALPDKRSIYYMFFSSGLLHWAHASIGLLPVNTNLVIVVSGLDADEHEWLSSTGRPVFAIPHHVDDKAVWELLFAANEANFGWIDVDCFIFNPRIPELFSEVPEHTSLNCFWSYVPSEIYKPSFCDMRGYDVEILRTFFLFINTQVVERVRRQVGPISPSVYSYGGGSFGRHMAGAVCRRPTCRQIALLRSVVPTSTDGLPRPPLHNGLFDTLVMYQLVAQALGYPIQPCQKVWSREPALRQYCGQIAHIGGASGYFKRDASVSPLALRRSAIWSCFLLRRSAPFLPARYRAALRDADADLREHGIRTDDVDRLVGEALSRRGVRPDIIAGFVGCETSAVPS